MKSSARLPGRPKRHAAAAGAEGAPACDDLPVDIGGRAGATRLAGLVVLAALLAGCGNTHVPDPAEPRQATPPASAREAAADTARRLLEQVRRVGDRPDVPGYDRDCGPDAGCVFGTDWSDDTDAPLGHNGCDTRNDVLARSLDRVTFSARSPTCDVVGGHLRDPYTDAVLDYATEGSQIHIDHLFPLAAAWDLGAADWSLDERRTFANDPDLELLAVSGSANLSKGDSTPASWLPPHQPYRCTYVIAYLEVALAYDLAVTDADIRVIEPVVRKWC